MIAEIRARSLPARLAVVLASLLGCAPLYAEQTIESGPGEVALLELYTSEGCSSCLPADRWLSSLEAGDGLWTDYVPVAFHVDYWDYIGWEDRFAASEFGARQRRYASEGAVDVVYTPGLMLDGAEWRQWRRGAAPVIARKREAGRLRAAVHDNDVRIEFQPEAGKRRDLAVHVAWLGFDLVSDVDAGETRGRQLHHDFVVLELSSTKLEPQAGAYTATVVRPDNLVSSPRKGLAVWVTADDSQAPLQAAGGWLAAAAE